MFFAKGLAQKPEVKFSGFFLYFRSGCLYQLQVIRPRSIALLLAFVTLVIYLPASSNEFINYDDPDYVADNPVVEQGLTWAGGEMGVHGCPRQQLASADLVVTHG